MLIFGLLLLIGAAGGGGWLGWENRHAIVHVRIDAHHVWTGHLYALLIVGVLLTCWFLLGASLIRCRIAERRRARAGDDSPAEIPDAEPAVRASRQARWTAVSQNQ